ncbi:MAG: HigA family addiction module antitoxin [Chitinophagales bacterium]
MNTLPNIHPGEVLLEEFITPLNINLSNLAKDLKISPIDLQLLIEGKSPMNASIALKLSHYFGTSAKFWLGLQNDFDLEEQGKLLVGELEGMPKIY